MTGNYRILLDYYDFVFKILTKVFDQKLCMYITGNILWMLPANERWLYIVTSSLIGWAHTQNDPRYHHQRMCYCHCAYHMFPAWCHVAMWMRQAVVPTLATTLTGRPVGWWRRLTFSPAVVGGTCLLLGSQATLQQLSVSLRKHFVVKFNVE